jgi:hypothetical protein
VKYIFTLGLLILFVSASSQPAAVDSADFYINKLGWRSSGVACKYFCEVAVYDDANRLIALPDPRKIQKLISHLGDSSKTVAIHLILTMILEPLDGSFGMWPNYGKAGKISSLGYEYNGLHWSSDSAWNYTISLEEVDNITNYWRERCPVPKESRWFFDSTFKIGADAPPITFIRQ